MSDREAKITFRAETSEFTNAIKQADSTIRQLKSGVRLMDSEMNAAGVSVDRLRQKDELLRAQQAQLQTKVDALTEKYRVACQVYGANSQEAQRYATQLNNAKSQLANCTAAVHANNTALESAVRAEKEADSALGQLTSEVARQENQMAQLGAEYREAILRFGQGSVVAQKLEQEIVELNASLQTNRSRLREADDAVEQLTTEVSESGAAVDDAEGKYSKWQAAIGNLISMGIQRGVDKIRELSTEVIDLGKDFETSMAKVQALSGATADEYAVLEEAARQYGSTTRFTASQSADAFGYMALAGWDCQQMLDGIPGVLNLAAAADMDLATASDIVTDYLTAFGLSAADSARFVDQMTYAMAHSNTNVEQLGEAYKNCAATAAAMGYSVEDTTAVLMTMANAGVKGGEAGTALNAIMTRLATDTKGCATELGKYGVSIYDAEGNMQSLSSILEGVSGVWGQLTDEQQANMAKTIAGTNHYSNLQTIMKGLGEDAKAGGQSFADYATALSDCGGAAQEMSDIMMDTAQGDLYTMQSALEEVGLKAYEKVEKPFRSLIQTITGPGTKALTWLIEHADVIPPIFVAIAAAILQMVKGSSGFTLVGNAVDTLRGKVKNLGTSLVALGKATAFTALITALALVAQKLMEAHQRAEKYRKSTDELRDASSSLYDAIDSGTRSVDGAGKSLGDYRLTLEDVREEIDALIESSAQLADSLNGIYAEAGTSIGMLDGYASVIQELGGSSDLTDEQIANLKLAVDGLNQHCGTSYTVAQDAGGAWQIMGDDAVVAKDKILELVDAQRIQIQMSAHQQAYEEAYKAQAEAARTAADAQIAFNEAEEHYNKLLEVNNGQLDANDALARSTIDAYNDAKAALDEANGLLDANSQATKAAADGMTLMQMAIDQGAGSIAAAVAGNSSLMASLDSLGISSLDFVEDMKLVGVSAEDLANASPELAAQIAQAYGEGFGSVSEVLSDNQIKFDETRIKQQEMFDALGLSISDFASATPEALAALAESCSGGLESVISVCQQQGVRIPDSIAAGIAERAGAPEDAQQVIYDALILKANNGDLVAANEQAGHDISQGLANGISENTLPQEVMDLLGQEMIDRLKELWGIHSPSTVAYGITTDVNQGLANGTDETSHIPVGAMGTLAQQMQDGIAGLPEQAQLIGAQSGQNLASALGSKSGQAYGAGATLAASGAQGASAQPGIWSGAGFLAGTLFGTGLNANSGVAVAAGTEFANSASSAAENEAQRGGQQAGTAGVRSFTDAIDSGRIQAERASKSAAQGSAKAANIPSEFYQSGRNDVQGLLNGASSLMGALREKGRAMAREMLEGLRQEAQENSPWKTTIRSGRYAVQGLMVGEDRELPNLVRKNQEIARKSYESLTPEALGFAWQLDSMVISNQVSSASGAGVSAISPVAILQRYIDNAFEAHDGTAEIVEAIEKLADRVTILELDGVCFAEAFSAPLDEENGRRQELVDRGVIL